MVLDLKNTDPRSAEAIELANVNLPILVQRLEKLVQELARVQAERKRLDQVFDETGRSG